MFCTILSFSLLNRATLVEHEDGKRTLLSKTDPNQRQAIAKRLLTPSTDIRTSVSPCKKVEFCIFLFSMSEQPDRALNLQASALGRETSESQGEYSGILVTGMCE